MPEWIPMRIITAVCFICTGTALMINKLNVPVNLKKILPGVFALFIILVSLATLYVYIYSVRTGHESSLTQLSYLTFFIAPGSRMAFLTAINFLLLGCIIFLLSADKTRANNLAHVLIIPVALVSYFVPVSYMLGVYSITELMNLPVALNTGIGFCGICAAVLLMNPDTWLLKVFTTDDTGGIIARKLLPPLMILPVFIAWLRINGERAGIFKSDEGVVLVALTYTICFLALVWLTARSVSKIDRIRHTSDKALKKSHERLEILSEIASRLLVSDNPQEIIYELCNRVMGFLDCQFFFNFIVDETEHKLHLNEYTGISVESAQKIEWIDFGVAVCECVTLEGKSFIAENIQETQDPRTDIIKSFGIKAYACHPLLSHERVIGTLSFGSGTQISFSEEDLSMMKIVADQVATAISRIRNENVLQSTKDYLENLINYANAPIIVWNPETRIQLFNHAFEHLTGYSSSEVEGKILDMLFPKPSLKESNAKIKDALTENWKTIEIPILTKNKEIRTVLWNSANIYDTDKKTVLSTIAQGNDITERVIAEQNVKERTKDLEVANTLLKQELTERIQAQQALRKSESQLKELNATKDKFFNIVAHDLKNPFTSLLGSSELLFRDIDKMDNDKIKTLASILNDASKSGYAILQNLLDWSRSQTGMLKFNPERINLNNLINENISNLQLLATNKDISLYSGVEEGIYIFADKNMINTILRNLLSNAVKFTHKCGKVAVSVIINSGEVIISVKDTGIGISKKNIDKLFRIDTKFSMPGTNNEQGTGLGLKLSKEFVEKQGGTIWVESIENKGSEFKFSIPFKEG
jgi:PAS domain S-box-containing protein